MEIGLYIIYFIQISYVKNRKIKWEYIRNDKIILSFTIIRQMKQNK